MIPVSATEYVNVRIRAFHSRLFRRETYDTLMDADNLAALTTYLLDSPVYHEDMEEALNGLAEREWLEQGVTDHFGRCVSHVFNMADGRLRNLFKIALASFDMKNLRVVILARTRGLQHHDVREMAVPCGVLDNSRITALLEASNIASMTESLATCCPIMASAVRYAGKSTGEDDSAVSLLNKLEQGFFQHVLRLLDANDADAAALRDVYRFEIDLKNIASALKYVWGGGHRGGYIKEEYIEGGSLGDDFLDGIAHASKLEDALEMIELTRYHEAVEKGIIYYAETGFFHEMERFFEEVFIRKTQSFKRFQPFGIGPFIAYVWAHFAEVTNLRTIINGIAFKTGAGQMRKGLLYV